MRTRQFRVFFAAGAQGAARNMPPRQLLTSPSVPAPMPAGREGGYRCPLVCSPGAGAGAEEESGAEAAAGVGEGEGITTPSAPDA